MNGNAAMYGVGNILAPGEQHERVLERRRSHLDKIAGLRCPGHEGLC